MATMNSGLGGSAGYGDIQWGASSSNRAYAGFTDGGDTDYVLEGSGNSTVMQSYEANDFDNGDPAGTFSFETVSGVPDVLVVGGTSGDDTMGLGFIDGFGNEITTGADYIDGGAGNDSIAGDSFSEQQSARAMSPDVRNAIIEAED